MSILNREDFATEIMRTIIGSIGLILAVPITSLVAVLMLKKKDVPGADSQAHKHDEDCDDPIGHSHGHICGHIRKELHR